VGAGIDPVPMKEFLKDQPIGRMGRSEEVAACVLWLCSPGASLVLGVALPVDGGFTAYRRHAQWGCEAIRADVNPSTAHRGVIEWSQSRFSRTVDRRIRGCNNAVTSTIGAVMRLLDLFRLGLVAMSLSLLGCASDKPPHYASAHKVGGGSGAQAPGAAGAGDNNGPSGGGGGS
jgi:hypothetical protein